MKPTFQGEVEFLLKEDYIENIAVDIDKKLVINVAVNVEVAED